MSQYAVVRWVDGKTRETMNVVRLSKIVCNDPAKILLGAMYQVKFAGGNESRCMVKSLGTFNVCTATLKTIQDNMPLASNTQTTSKEKPKKASKKSDEPKKTVKKSKESSKAEIELHALQAFSDRQATTIVDLKKRSDKQVKRIDSLVESVKYLEAVYSKEEIGRMVGLSLNVLKAFGTHNDIVEISQHDRDSDTMVGMTRISPNFVDVLMASEKRKDLIATLEAGLKTHHVFKSAMLVFFPDETHWITRNAENFFKESMDIVNAIVEFINEHANSATERFTLKLARQAITQKCSDLKKKVRKIKKASELAQVEKDSGIESLTTPSACLATSQRDCAEELGGTQSSVVSIQSEVGSVASIRSDGTQATDSTLHSVCSSQGSDDSQNTSHTSSVDSDDLPLSSIVNKKKQRSQKK